MAYPKILSEIKALDAEALQAAKERQARLAKPPGSLGGLEDMSIQLAGISGKVKNELNCKRVIVLCADNGVVEEGVSVTPRSVTMTQAVNMTKRKTGMSSMAKHFGVDVCVVDVGIHDPYRCEEIINRKIVAGTKNLHVEPAMTRDEVIRAINVGIEMAEKAKKDGCDVIGVGEMGIGNTTTSSAVVAALTGLAVRDVTGRGGGLTDAALEKKYRVIEEALALHKPDPADVIDVLSKVGGLDIAAMCGVFLGAAKERIPVVIDGFISAVAALCAGKLCSLAAKYMFASHQSTEPGYLAAMQELKLKPYLDLSMRLGEGSGCIPAFQVMEAACAAMNGMAEFGEEADIDDSYLDEIRNK